jgi:hypothetical protein
VHEAVNRLAAEVVRVEGVREIVIDVCRIERRDEIGKRMAVRGFAEGAERRVSGDVEVGELLG